MSSGAGTCDACQHFDQEQMACLELVNAAGGGTPTTWEPKSVGLAGRIDMLQRTEWHVQPKPQDECHFSPPRWAPRQHGQGPDPI